MLELVKKCRATIPKKHYEILQKVHILTKPFIYKYLIYCELRCEPLQFRKIDDINLFYFESKSLAPKYMLELVQPHLPIKHAHDFRSKEIFTVWQFC